MLTQTRLFRKTSIPEAARLAMLLNNLSRQAKVARYCMQTTRPEWRSHGATVKGTYVPTTQAELRAMADELSGLALDVWNDAIAPAAPGLRIHTDIYMLLSDIIDNRMTP